jgi:hypothetical protein
MTTLNNKRRIWEPDEVKQLREMAKAGKSPTLIALRLKRRVGAVKARLTILGIPVRSEPVRKPRLA